MKTVVQLSGAWPEGVEDRIAKIVSDEVSLERDEHAPKGALSWGDIGAIVQSAGAVISVLLTIWQIRQATRAQAALPGREELNLMIRQEGIFGAEIVEVAATGHGTVEFKVLVRDMASGEVIRFDARRSGDKVSLRVDR